MSSQVKVKIDYSINEDVNNWVRFLSLKRDLFGLKSKDLWKIDDSSLKKKLKGKSKKEMKDILLEYLSVNDFEKKEKVLKKDWQNIEKRYFKALADVTERKIYAQDFFVSLTTYYMCPYNTKKKWFMVSSSRPLSAQRLTIAHELMHLQFIHYYQKYCMDKGLTKKEFEDLKESLTVLLNYAPFKSLVKAKDLGYKPHQKLRGYIAKEWKRNKDFKKLLDNSIEYIKETS